MGNGEKKIVYSAPALADCYAQKPGCYIPKFASSTFSWMVFFKSCLIGFTPSPK